MKREKNTALAQPIDPLVEAQKVIEAQRKLRVDACRDEIDAILKKHNCTLQVFFASPGVNQFVANVGVVALS